MEVSKEIFKINTNIVIILGKFHTIWHNIFKNTLKFSGLFSQIFVKRMELSRKFWKIL